MAGRTRSTSNSPTGHGGGSFRSYGEEDDNFTYESIIGGDVSPGEGGEGLQEAAAAKAVEALSTRLTTFREWLSEEAGVDVHPSICIVNGEATDGTKNAPVLAFGPPPGSQNALNKKANPANGRVGLVDSQSDRALYDRTMGCQVRTAKEIKKDEVMMNVPRSAMVTPDLVASSDAGKAVLACCRVTRQSTFWDTFENTTICEAKFTQKVRSNTGTQLLVKILQERKRAEGACAKALQKVQENDTPRNESYTLAEFGMISTRAPVLAFLIHQRFSNQHRPPVSSEEANVLDEFKKARESGDGSAIALVKDIVKPPGSPATFAPYARTLPSSVSLPLSWKRNELALLAGCIAGTAALQEVAAQTAQLASEFIALLNAGILHRFPSTFPPGLITWERWVWAAVCMQSRILPATCYLNDGDENASAHVPKNAIEFQSPPEIWDELGVMIPLLDMVNHEVEAHQVTFQPCVPSNDSNGAPGQENCVEFDNHHNSTTGRKQPHPPRAIVHKRVRKGSQIYCCYGNLSNQTLILQYGFAQLGNPLDEVRLGWGLADAVGNIERPLDYVSPFEDDPSPNNDLGAVYDTIDQDATTKWWTEERLALLEREAFRSVEDTFMQKLKNGKKMMASASSDGVYHPFLLTVAAIGTMPAKRVKRTLESDSKDGIELTKTHQRIIRNYLTYIFARKMEKLLQNVNQGLSAHFATLNLWTKATEGGLRYSPEEVDGAEPQFTGWQTFFDAHAYIATLEIENRYYAMGADSCVLTLFDGQLRSLQASLDGLSTAKKFEDGALRQLEDLDFRITDVEDDLSDISDVEMKVKVKEEAVTIEKEEVTAIDEDNHKDNGKMEIEPEPPAEEPDATFTEEPHESDKKDEANKEQQQEKDGDAKEKEKDKDGKDVKEKDSKDNKEPQDEKDSKSKGGNDSGQKKKEESKKSSPSKSSRRRNKRKNAAAANSNNNHLNDRPPAIKLHIGNLAYSTTPSTLYEFFSSMCGRENVLECHIPTERDTGRSRGFGFVTLPEPVARQILKSGKKYEVDGRPLKIAESNSAGSGKSTRLPVPPPMAAGERCANCGYRPKYCVCRVPNIPGFGPPHPPPPPPPPHMHPHGPPPEMMDYGRDYDYYGGGGGRFRDDRFSHSTSPFDRPRPGDRDRGPYARDLEREPWGYPYERSRSPSYGRSESRVRDKSRRDRKGRDRSRSRSRSPRGRRRERDSDRRWGHRRSSSRSRSRSRSYSSASSRSRSPPSGKRDYDPAAAPSSSSRKEKQTENSTANEHSEEARAGASASSTGNNKPRESRKRSHSRGGGRKKKKSKRRSTRSRSRSASPRGA